ncbi:MAG TPA: hypothetical protein VJQ47_03260 [Steroidobacteraceae bacterium]|nr:hypothetical protein [Steroidobacteraceae bacterium]
MTAQELADLNRRVRALGRKLGILAKVRDLGRGSLSIIVTLPTEPEVEHLEPVAESKLLKAGWVLVERIVRTLAAQAKQMVRPLSSGYARARRSGSRGPG